MAIKDATTLKGYFNNGDVPSESDFNDLIDTIFGIAGGDMLRSVYDPDLDNIIESADYAANADTVDGQHASAFAPIANGVTNGNSHDHNGGDGGQISHTSLSSIGTNTHATLDTFLSSKAAANGLASLNSSSKVVQDPANATSTPTASKIPLADGSGKLDGWISDGTTAVKGKVELATDGETASGVAVQGNDARLSNARTPTTHATSHKSGGSDSIKLDELAAPTDITTLNASVTTHGLLPKLPNDVNKYLNGLGSWATIAAPSSNVDVIQVQVFS